MYIYYMSKILLWSIEHVVRILHPPLISILCIENAVEPINHMLYTPLSCDILDKLDKISV